MSDEPEILTGRDEIEALLPWYAAGVLEPDEARRVAAAIAADPMLARSYEAAREELGDVAHLNEQIPAPTARIMDKLVARLDAEPVRRPSPWRAVADRFAGFVDSLSPRVLALAGAAAAVVMVIEAGVISQGWFKPSSGGGGHYVTASVGAASTQAGAFLLIRFSDDATAAEITALMTARHAHIVDGPTADGFYKVKVAPARIAADKLAALAGDWQSQKPVAFAAASK